MQVAVDELGRKKLCKSETRLGFRHVARDEQRVAAEPVAVGALDALVRPALQIGLRNRIVVDREQEIGRDRVRALGPREQLCASVALGDQHDGLDEAAVAQLLLDTPREAEIE